MFDRVIRGFLHPIVSVVSVPPVLVLLEPRLRLPRLPNGVRRLVAISLVIPGFALICWSVISLVTQGRGTPNPDSPPNAMVEEGPYRYSRNPMVIGMLLLLLGMGVLARSLLLLIYVPTLGLVTQFYLVRTEEPELIERFGQAYRDYQLRVPRWLRRGPVQSQKS